MVACSAFHCRLNGGHLWPVNILSDVAQSSILRSCGTAGNGAATKESLILPSVGRTLAGWAGDTAQACGSWFVIRDNMGYG